MGETAIDLGESELLDLDDDQSVEAALARTLAAEIEVEKGLDMMLEVVGKSSRSRVERLGELAVTAGTLGGGMSDLRDLILEASRVSETVSAKVKDLDGSYRKCEGALLRVEDVIALRGCAEGVRSALASSDLVTACEHVAKYLKLGERTKAELDSESGTFASISQVNESISDLTAAIRKKADEAAKGNSVDQVAQTVKLFVPIGYADEGLKRFTDYLKAVIHKESSEDVRTLLMEVDAPDPAQEEPHVVCLTRLFETVAGYLDDVEKVTVENFGAMGLIFVIEQMQMQCDVESNRILSRYAQERRLDEFLRLLNQRTADGRLLDPILDEQAVISQRTVRYFAFLSGRVFDVLQADDKLAPAAEAADDARGDDLESKSSLVHQSSILSPKGVVPATPRGSVGMRTPSMTPKPAPDASPLETAEHSFAVFLRNCGLEKQIEEVTTRYITMEAYFMQENVLKAIRIDDPPIEGSGAKTSTAVDDIFFVLQKCVHRAVSYVSLLTLCAVINYVNLAIGGDLLDFVKKRLSDTEKVAERVATVGGESISGRLLAEKSTKNSEDKKPSYGYTVALNNAQLSSEFSVRLRTEVEKKAFEAFNTPRDHAQINAVLAQLSESSRAFSTTAEEGLDKLSSALTRRLGAAMDAVHRVSYQLQEAEYQDQERGEQFITIFLSCVEKHALGDLEEYLTESNWDGLVRRLAEWSTKTIENSLFGVGGGNPKRVNALGALQLDRDVRAISTFFAQASRRGTVRDVFARLSQIAMLINFEKPTEVYDLWGPNSGGMTWRLTPTEVRKALLLRVDFNAEAIRTLRL